MVIITKDKRTRWKDDFYPTPDILCNKICESLVAELPKGGRVLDPGCGDGSFGKAIKSYFPDCHLVGIDIVDRLSDHPNRVFYDQYFLGDYTDQGNILMMFGMNREDMFRLVIGNPPFKHAESFVRISRMICNGQVLFLFKLAFLAGQDRASNFFAGIVPSSVSVLNARVSWDGSGKSNDQDHAVFEWDTKYPAAYGHTKLSWLNWR